MDPTTGSITSLTAGGVTVLIDATGDGLPAIAYWGPALPSLDASMAQELLRATEPVQGTNNISRRPRLSPLPEHATGWTGRPGLSGSASGIGWSLSSQIKTLRLYASGHATPVTDERTDANPIAGDPPGDGGIRVAAAGGCGTAPADDSGTAAAGNSDAVAAHDSGRAADGGPAIFNVGAGRLVAHAVDDAGRLGLELEIELLASGLVRARARVENLGLDTYTVDGLVLSFPVPERAGEVLDFAGRHNLERVPQRVALRTGIHLRENRKGRTGADSAYVLHVGTPGFGFAEGDIWAVHTAWSGNHVHYAERVFTGEQVIGGGELLLPGEMRLDRSESYRSPWVYGAYGKGLDAIARRFHRHLRSRSRAVDTKRPVTLNVWEAVYFDHDAERLIDLAERAANVGVERFVLDDGWFGSRRDDTSGLGDWVVSADVWPAGLHPLIDRVKSLGMQFGLWFEPEMVNPDSDLARAHPEWIMAARAEWPVESRRQQVLNLGIPAAFEHIKGQLLAILDEYAIDYVKWDHNRDLIEAGNQLDGGRPGVHAQTLAFYRLLDEIRAAHPALEIESCSSGGGRIDLGVLERADRVWVSDNIDPHDRQAMLRWTTQLIPPEMMGSHIAADRSHETGRRHSLGFRAATALFGHLGIEWDLAHATSDQVTQLSEWVAFFKEHRELLLGGDIVRMDGYHDGVLVHGVVASDRSRALFAMVTLESPYPDPPGRLRFRGLDPDRVYRIRPVRPVGVAPPWWRTGALISGAALDHVGVACPRVHPDQAVLYRADPA